MKPSRILLLLGAALLLFSVVAWGIAAVWQRSEIRAARENRAEHNQQRVKEIKQEKAQAINRQISSTQGNTMANYIYTSTIGPRPDSEGKYEPSGTHNGATLYIHETSGWYLYWNIDYSLWGISGALDEDFGNIEDKSVNGDIDTVPLTGWGYGTLTEEAVTCPTGYHDDGTGTCVADPTEPGGIPSCAVGYYYDGTACVANPEGDPPFYERPCAPGFVNTGTFCMPAGDITPGSPGDPVGYCSPGYWHDGTGCVPQSTSPTTGDPMPPFRQPCAAGYYNDGDACVPIPEDETSTPRPSWEWEMEPPYYNPGSGEPQPIPTVGGTEGGAPVPTHEYPPDPGYYNPGSGNMLPIPQTGGEDDPSHTWTPDAGYYNPGSGEMQPIPEDSEGNPVPVNEYPPDDGYYNDGSGIVPDPVQGACWWSKQLPTAALAAAWPVTDADGNDRTYKRVTGSIINPVAAEEAADNYVYTLHANAPGNSTDIADYQLLDDKRHALFLGAEQSVRFVMCREPLLRRRAYQTFDALHAVRLHAYEDSVAVLTHEPNRVLSFDGSIIKEIVDLSSFTDFTPIDVAYLDNRFYVVMEPTGTAPATALPHIRVVDLDSTDRPYRLLPDEDNAPLTAVARFDGKLWIAATTGADEATIYSYGGGDLQRPVAVATVKPVIRFDVRNGASETLRAACAGGHVYEITDDGATLLVNTAEADALSLFSDGAIVYVGTGDEANLITNRTGAWAVEESFLTPHVADWAQVLALAALNSSAYAGGDGAGLYQRRGGEWVLVDTLADTDSINDMLELDGVLLMATSGTSPATARLHTRRVTTARGVIAQTVPKVAFGLEMKA